MANRNIQSAVRVALLAAGAAGAGIYAPGSLAQDQEIEQIVVTGSRIPQPNLEGTSPVSVIGSEDIKLQGVTTVEDMINTLPQAFAAQGANLANGATGTATVDLRNLGSNRTLVLMNGRRMPMGTPSGTATSVSPDLNQIPAPLIERVEVLTGGASAVYGSDAVAGVVNFIMNDNFEGVQFDVNYNFFNHQNDNKEMRELAKRPENSFVTPAPKWIGSDGETYEISLTMGSNFADDRGNATVYAGYRNAEALDQGQRDTSACALDTDGDDWACGGSSTNDFGRVIDLNEGSSWQPNLGGDPSAGFAEPVPWSRLFNYNPYNYYQRPDERYTAAVYAHYDISDDATAYTEINFHDDRSVWQIAPTGTFNYDLGVGTSCSNPLLSDAWVDTLCTANGLGADDRADIFVLRRNVEGGSRQGDMRHTSYRGVVGLKGELFDDKWNYDLYGQYGTVVFQYRQLNDWVGTHIARALDVVADPDTGQPVCQSVVDGTDPNCLPYDFWSGNPSQESINYLYGTGFQTGDTKQTIVHAELSSDLGEYGVTLPTANSGIGLALGAEYREESLSLDTDVYFRNNLLSGLGGPSLPISGGYNVTDLFAEVRMPIAEGIFLADTLTLNASYRYSDYSIDIETNTYGIGLDWGPIQSLKFRGSYQRAVRAPNVVELFQGVGVGLYDNDEDPCSGPTPTESLEACRGTFRGPDGETFLPDSIYGNIIDNPAGQYNNLSGGNVDLKEETADSYTVGLVWAPTGILDGLSLTLDWFDISVEDVISQVPPTTTLNQCLAAADPNNAFCQAIRRDSIGTLWAQPTAYIDARNANLASLDTSGLDVNFGYNLGMGSMGSLGFSLTGTYLDEFVQEDFKGAGKYDCKGLHGSTCGTPLPEWRHKFRATWMMPWNADVSLGWRYYDEVEIDRSSSNPILVGNYDSKDKKLDAQNYIDLAASWTIFENYTLRGGINNIFDEDAPVASIVGAGSGNGNTYPQVYDALGRYVFLGFTARY
jgi:outer membrane receptor protein involved in Fe transport